MRTLLVAAASVIGLSLLSAGGASALPANAAAVRDAASESPAVTPVRYYYYVYHWRYRPVYHYRYGWHYRHRWHRY
jgi:hypothetical protein